MAEAPSGDRPLKTDEAVDILEEILEAQNVSYVLGLKLKLPQHVVEAIHSTHLRPRERLLHVLIEFTRLAEPRPTWRVIVDALRTSAVNLPRLADKVEAAHFPNLSSVRDLVAQTGPLPPTSSTTQDSAKPLPSPVSIFERSATTLRGEIRGFHRRFNTLKESTIQCLETCHIAVMTVVYMLTSILAVDEHKVFLEEKHRVLYECNHHLQLFGLLNLYWNYLAYDLLDQLIEELTLKNEAFEDIAGQMATYKNDLQLFRENTPLDLFCQAVPAMEDDPPPGFRKVVVKFNWPNTVTLEDVERFRSRYALMYDLKKCAMMLNSVRRGSFKVTWFVPLTIVKILRKEMSPSVFVQHNVSAVVVAGHAVYEMSMDKSESEQEHEDYHFVEEPSDDLCCPVTCSLLLQPHLTSCCGKHLSQEAVKEIQKKEGACPLCNKPCWSTMLNKDFQRQVNELHVFCRYRERGCSWRGSLCEFKRHIKFCKREVTAEEKGGETEIIDSILLEAVGCLMHQENCRIPRCPCKRVKKRFQHILPQTRLHMQQEANRVVEEVQSGTFDPTDRRQQMRISLSSQNFSRDIHPHYHMTSHSHIRQSDGRKRLVQRRRSKDMDLTPVIEQPESCATTPGVIIADGGAREFFCGPTFSPALTPTGEKLKVLAPPSPSSNTIVPPVLLREISLSADNLPSLCLNDCPMAATPLMQMSKRELSSAVHSSPSSMTQYHWSDGSAPEHSIETESDSKRKSSSSVDSLTTNQEGNQISSYSIPSPTNHPTSREDFLRQIRTRSGDSGIETSTATQYQPPGTSGTIKYRTSDGRVITVTETLV